MFKYISILLLCSQIAWATDPITPDNVYLTKSTPAPYAGILFPLDRAQRVELMNIDLSTCTKRLDLSTQDTDLLNKQVSTLTDETSNLRTELSKKTGFWDTFGGFIIGSAATVLVAFSVSRATR